ncbi:conjugal transfer protein TraI [Actinophytocola sp.]|uniref:conjugal transfer protein TraI n=1 Tax=Actinophytocola sp. TaxID=1872138 RepID=UPI003899F19A
MAATHGIVAFAGCLAEGTPATSSPKWCVMTVAHDPDDGPEFDLTEIERYLAAHSTPVGDEANDDANSDTGADTGTDTDAGVDHGNAAASTNDRRTREGRTRRVRKLAGDVAEARQLVALQDSAELVYAHSQRVLRTIRRGAEAVKLVQLRQNPAFLALATVRARRTVTATGLAALVIALGWSTAGVQAFAAGNTPRFSAQWWFAWGVEPFVSLALLTIVIARAFLASRGQTITTPTVRRVEWLFLSATLLMNTWRHLPGVATPFRFDQLVIHMLGPIVAVCVVTVLPLLWVAIDNVPTRAPTTTPAEDTQPDNATKDGSKDPTEDAPSGVDQRAQERVAAALAKATALIHTGRLPPNPSANRLHKALGGAMDTARAVRDILRRGP